VPLELGGSLSRLLVRRSLCLCGHFEFGQDLGFRLDPVRPIPTAGETLRLPNLKGALFDATPQFRICYRQFDHVDTLKHITPKVPVWLRSVLASLVPDGFVATADALRRFGSTLAGHAS
jgi:hypothetical protein